jgi:hypothetical protein
MTDQQEEFKINGQELLAKVKEVIEAGKARKIIIKNESGDSLLEIPLHVGVPVAALSALVAPILVAVGALAGILTKCSIVVVKKEDSGPTIQA